MFRNNICAEVRFKGILPYETHQYKMTIYNVELYNDMGHLMTRSEDNTPSHIINFVYDKSINCLYTATGITYPASYFILKDGLSPTWAYSCGNDIVNVRYNVDTFDSTRMKRIENHPYALPIQPFSMYDSTEPLW